MLGEALGQGPQLQGVPALPRAHLLPAGIDLGPVPPPRHRGCWPAYKVTVSDIEIGRLKKILTFSNHVFKSKQAQNTYSHSIIFLITGCDDDFIG